MLLFFGDRASLISGLMDFLKNIPEDMKFMTDVDFYNIDGYKIN